MKTMPWINALFILPHTRCYNFGTIRDAIMQRSYPVQFFYFAGETRKEKKPFSFNTGFNRDLAGDLDLVHKAVKQNLVKRVSRQ